MRSWAGRGLALGASCSDPVPGRCAEPARPAAARRRRRAQHRDPDFFSRKAIGWALRDRQVGSAWVRRFVDEHPALSGLSRREALQARWAVVVTRATSPRREILRLAVPAFLALIAEPLFLLADSAIVGHLGTAELAELGVASAALITAAASSSSSPMARRASWRASSVPATRERQLRPALTDSGSPWASGWPPRPSSRPSPSRSVRSSAPRRRSSSRRRPTFASRPSGSPGCWSSSPSPVCFAACRTPAHHSSPPVLGFGANVVLNLVFVYGLHWGIAGSAWGTGHRPDGHGIGTRPGPAAARPSSHAPLHPHPGRVLGAARPGSAAHPDAGAPSRPAAHDLAGRVIR